MLELLLFPQATTEDKKRSQDLIDNFECQDSKVLKLFGHINTVTKLREGGYDTFHISKYNELISSDYSKDTLEDHLDILAERGYLSKIELNKDDQTVYRILSRESVEPTIGPARTEIPALSPPPTFPALSPPPGTSALPKPAEYAAFSLTFKTSVPPSQLAGPAISSTPKTSNSFSEPHCQDSPESPPASSEGILSSVINRVETVTQTVQRSFAGGYDVFSTQFEEYVDFTKQDERCISDPRLRVEKNILMNVATAIAALLLTGAILTSSQDWFVVFLYAITALFAVWFSYLFARAYQFACVKYIWPTLDRIKPLVTV
ncbi:hypothetical protein [Halovenus sp. HT40]|uniref:hypothetical protein n=1 Tax=Halovenus sp. HT40 TaxID=3126691 RepID=UPI00300EA8A3